MKKIFGQIKEHSGKVVFTIGVIFLSVGCIAAFNRYFDNLARQESEDKKLAGDTAVHYYDLSYKEFGSSGETHLLCTELAAEGKCDFQPGKCYEVQFDFPEAMLEEIASGQDDYEIQVTYDRAVPAGMQGYLWFNIVNHATGQTYIAQSGFGAEEDLYLQHQAPKYMVAEDQKSLSLFVEVGSTRIEGATASEYTSELGKLRVEKIDGEE